MSEQTSEPMSGRDVHEVVTERYGEIARSGAPIPEAGESGPRPTDIAERLGYESDEIAAVPEGANLGLGCGAPIGRRTASRKASMRSSMWRSM